MEFQNKEELGYESDLNKFADMVSTVLLKLSSLGYIYIPLSFSKHHILKMNKD